MLRRLPSESALAFVLAHEAGHVVGRHALENLAMMELRKGVAASSIAANGGTLTPSTYTTIKRATLAYSRAQEHEADELGIKGFLAAGYDRAGWDHFAKVLDIYETATPEIELDHPTKASRVTDVATRVLPAIPSFPGDVGIARYRANVQARLARLPPQAP
jgi:predicted Zn-dependent protease